ncbi:MAG: hypothetical protein HYR85_03780 [Planctomycetes bacterium]|nr:hypothetical protein [Planctomycetota bacterium]
MPRLATIGALAVVGFSIALVLWFESVESPRRVDPAPRGIVDDVDLEASTPLLDADPPASDASDVATASPPTTSRKQILRGRLVGVAGPFPERPTLSIASVSRAEEWVTFSKTIRADAAGTFEADVSDLFVAMDVARLEVSADPSELITGSASVDVPESASEGGEFQVDVPVSSATIVVGRVVDDAGEPIAFAVVRLWKTPHGVPSGSILTAQTTGPSGRFTLRAGDGGSVFILALAPGRRSAGEFVGARPAALTDAHDLVLDRGYAIRGHVANADQKPFAGAHVRAVIDGPARGVSIGGTMELVGDRAVTTQFDAFADNEGRFELTGLEPAAYRLSLAGLQSSAYPEGKKLDWGVVAPADGVELSVPAPAWIELTVRSEEDPPPNALVRLFRDGQAIESRRIIGVTSLGVFPGAFYEIRVSCDHYEEERVDVVAPAAGEKRTVAVTLEPLRNPPGIVIDLTGPDGKPITDARFDLFAADAAWPAWERGTSSEKGHYRLAELEPGRYRLMIEPGTIEEASANWFVPTIDDLEFVRNGGERVIEVRALVGGRLRFVAHDAEGRPIRAQWRVLEPSGRSVLGSGLTSPATLEGVTGRVLPPGSYVVECSADGWTPRTAEAAVVAGETGVVDLTLQSP